MPEPTRDELLARIEELEKQAQPRQKGVLSFKVSEKGAVSVYGLGRFPVTLYREQWTKLFSATDDILQFIEQNKDRLKTKSD